MFLRNKPIVFDPYRDRRRRRHVPRWLVLLLAGTALGAGGVLYVQQQLLPPRLSADESAHLRQAYGSADAERRALKAELATAQQRLQTALAERERAQQSADTDRALVEELRADLAVAVEALPPDPRDGTVEVRAAQFTPRGGDLAYEVVLSRAARGDKPLEGVMQLVVSGTSPTDADASVALQPVALKMGRHEVERGRVPLPTGFRPRQVTVKILDDHAGRQLGKRVLLVD